MKLRALIIPLLLPSLLSVASHAQNADAPLTRVIAIKAEKQHISDHIEALGTLKANEFINLTTTVTEKITALHFDDGERVEKGTVLAEMTSNEEHALLEEARATLAEARKQYTRFKQLAATSAASKSVLDQRKREMDTAHARLEAIESRMADRLIEAPFAGVVGLRNISVGALVEPGDSITTLYDDSVMKLDFTVPATFLTALKPGLPIEATSRAYDDTLFEGTVKSIDPGIDPITRSISVRALLPNPEGRLKPGLLMSVELFKNPRHALTLPEEALLMEGERHFVYRIEEGDVVQKQQVTLGTRFKGTVEILSGIEVGDTIITRGMMNVRPGQKVRVDLQSGEPKPRAGSLPSASGA